MIYGIGRFCQMAGRALVASTARSRRVQPKDARWLPVCFKSTSSRTADALSNSRPLADGPLTGIRVLDLTRVLAGPYCTMLLADIGADVIKIERPRQGDDTRHWGPPWAPNRDPKDSGQPESAYFLAVNRNKRSLTLNLKSPHGVKIARQLAEKCDVLVENYLPGKLDEIGLGWQELSAVNPRLVYCSITGYGQTGPYASRAGYDVMVEAEAGLMYITGEEDGPPVKVGVAITDLTAGLYAHGAILASLLARATTNRGEHIDCSLIESQVASLVNIGSSYLIAGQEAQRYGTAHASIVPYQVMPTSDGHIMIGAGNERQFQILCKILGCEELAHDERFHTNADRVQHRQELIALLKDCTQCKTTNHWLHALEGQGIPYAPINNIQKTFEHPQVMARGMIREVEHPRAGRIKLVGIPVKYANVKPRIRLPPPALGQHTHEVLSGLLGYTDEDIRELESENAI